MIKIKCGCGKAIAAKDEWAGRKVKCPGCGKAIAVPGAAAPKPPKPPKPGRPSKVVLILSLILLASLGLPALSGGRGGVFAWSLLSSKSDYGSEIVLGFLVPPLSALLVLPVWNSPRRGRFFAMALLAGAASIFAVGAFAGEISNVFGKFQELRCKINLNHVGNAVNQYAYVNKGKIPERIEDLAGLVRSETLTCPVGGGGYKLASKQELSVYLRGSPSRTLAIAWDEPGNHWGGGFILRADGDIVRDDLPGTSGDVPWRKSPGTEAAFLLWTLGAALAAALGFTRGAAARPDVFARRVLAAAAGLTTIGCLLVPMKWGYDSSPLILAQWRGPASVLPMVMAGALLLAGAGAALSLLKKPAITRLLPMGVRLCVLLSAALFAVAATLAQSHALVGLGQAIRLFVPIFILGEGLALLLTPPSGTVRPGEPSSRIRPGVV